MILEKMFEYYAAQDVQPTYADFGDDVQLSKYEALRKLVFSRLALPPAVFKGASILEFGPDTGENSLVFARWGAHMTLVEPNTKAHPYIRRYFEKFGMQQSLDDIVSASLLDFQPSRKYDVIDAEGFIYTIQPTSAWISKAAECLELDGLLIVSYNELYGAFMELLLKSIYHSVVRSGSYTDGIESVQTLFQPKWDSIAHTRKIESWFMDVILNPFVRAKYFIDPVVLQREMQAGGFRLHSSWPSYRDALSIQWIKAGFSEEDELDATVEFIEQSRLSHFLGSKCYQSGRIPELNGRLAALIEIADKLIDEPSVGACGWATGHIDAILDSIRPDNIVASDQDFQNAVAVLKMIRSIFDLMQKNKVDELVQFCRTDRTFIKTWGMPNHHGVFQKARET
jgi:hypothetical protein